MIPYKHRQRGVKSLSSHQPKSAGLRFMGGEGFRVRWVSHNIDTTSPAKTKDLLAPTPSTMSRASASKSRFSFPLLLEEERGFF
jgi:hypothetical protein